MVSSTKAARLQLGSPPGGGVSVMVAAGGWLGSGVGLKIGSMGIMGVGVACGCASFVAVLAAQSVATIEVDIASMVIAAAVWICSD